MEVVFPTPLTPMTSTTAGLPESCISPSARSISRMMPLQGLQRVRACLEVLAAHLLAQLLHQPHGHIRARIRQDQLFLQVVVQLVGDLARIHKARDGAEDGIPRFAQSLAQFFKKAQSVSTPFINIRKDCPAPSGNKARVHMLQVQLEHLGHAVLLHRHTVQHVGLFHGAAAVGDDDELCLA